MAIKIPAKNIYGEIQHEKLKKNRITEFSTKINQPITKTEKIEFFNDVYTYDAGQEKYLPYYSTYPSSLYTKDGFEFKQFDDLHESCQIIKIKMPQNTFLQKSLGTVSQNFYDFLTFYVSSTVTFGEYEPKKTAFANIKIIENFYLKDGFPYIGNDNEEFLIGFGKEISSIRIFKHPEYSNWEEYGFVGIYGGFYSGTTGLYTGILQYELSVKIKDIIDFEEVSYTKKSSTDTSGNAFEIESCPYFQSQSMAETAAKNIFGSWGAGKETVVLDCSIDNYLNEYGNAVINASSPKNLFPAKDFYRKNLSYHEDTDEIYSVGMYTTPNWENRQAEIKLNKGHYIVDIYKNFTSGNTYNNITIMTQSQTLFSKEHKDEDWNGSFYVDKDNTIVGFVVNLDFRSGGEEIYDAIKVYLYKGNKKEKDYVTSNAKICFENGNIVELYVINENRQEVPLSKDKSGNAIQYKVMGVELDGKTLLQKLHLQEV